MIDGMRWQEIYRGVDPALIKTIGPAAIPAAKERAAYAEKLFARATPAESRAALMPFLWNTVALNGQLFGNRDLGSDSHVTNGYNFSYPGYNDTLTGVPDPKINSNDNIANPTAHRATTGPEIWADTGGTVTHLVAGIGTGGTVSGAGGHLKEISNGRVTVVGADPATSVYGGGDGSPFFVEAAGHYLHPDTAQDVWPRSYHPGCSTASR